MSAATTVYDWRYTKDDNCYATEYGSGFKVYIYKKRLDGRAKEKGKQLRLGPLDRKGEGFYPSLKAAEGEVFLWRMDVEGYKYDDEEDAWTHPRRQVAAAAMSDDEDEDEDMPAAVSPVEATTATTVSPDEASSVAGRLIMGRISGTSNSSSSSSSSRDMEGEEGGGDTRRRKRDRTDEEESDDDEESDDESGGEEDGGLVTMLVPETRGRPRSDREAAVSFDPSDYSYMAYNSSSRRGRRRPRQWRDKKGGRMGSNGTRTDASAMQVVEDRAAKRLELHRRGQGQIKRLTECLESDEKLRSLAAITSPRMRRLYGEDAASHLAEKQLSRLRQQASSVRAFYVVADMRHKSVEGGALDTQQCFEEARLLSGCPFDARAVERWERLYRKNQFCFPADRRGDIDHPTLLRDNDDLMLMFKSWLRENIKNLTVEAAAEYVNTVLIWKVADDPCDAIDILASYGIDVYVDPSTVWAWMSSADIGATIGVHKPTFYCDAHERADVVDYREKVYLPLYFELELRAHLWWQVTKEESDLLIEKGKVADVGYKYKTDGGVEMVEYNVHDSEAFDELRAKEKFGGKLSVRFPAGQRPVLFIGQDETAFKQYAYRRRQWSICGVTALLPKSGGKGLMLSLIQCEVWGCGFPMTDEELKRVNNYRIHHSPNYISEESAAEVCKMQGVTPTTIKPLLENTPGRTPGNMALDIGANNEKYWTSHHFNLQIEDLLDCLHVLYPDFQPVIEVDHSMGHGKSRSGALDAMGINKCFGGKQSIRRDSDALTKECIGKFRPILKEGDIQFGQFKGTDPPPFYAPLTPKEDNNKGQKIVERKKKKKKGGKHSMMAGAADAAKEVQKANMRCTRSFERQQKDEEAEGGETEQVTVDDIEFGYVGKQKGLLDLCWERGLLDIYDEGGAIDKKKLARYSLQSKLDESTGLMSDEFNLRAIMAKQPDYENEESHVEWLVKEKGGIVLKSPKCHPEIAGQGIEYSNGKAKFYFRKNNTGAASSYEELVHQSVSQDVLTLPMIRRFARKVREYKLAYWKIMQEKNTGTGHAAQQSDGDGAASLALIEKYRRQFKSHRSALDTDKKFIESA